MCGARLHQGLQCQPRTCKDLQHQHLDVQGLVQHQCKALPCATEGLVGTKLWADGAHTQTQLAMCCLMAKLWP